MQIQTFTFNPFQENTYVLFNKQEAVIVDPGNYTKEEDAVLHTFIKETKLTVKSVLLTHSHIDHILGLKNVLDTYKITVFLHTEDLKIYDRAMDSGRVYGINYNPSFVVPTPYTSSIINPIQGVELEIRFIPGHSPGHVVFINHASKIGIVGDTIFENSIGRSDLPYGNHDTLIQGIKEHLLSLPNDFTLYSGHGNPTTVGNERFNNPFLQ